MNVRTARWAITAAVASVLGCGTDSFSSPAPDSESEGESGAADAATSEASTDAGGADGGPDAPEVPFSCAALSPAPRFCADFDEGSLLSAYNSGILTSSLVKQADPGADITSAATGNSQPDALEASTAGVATGPGPHAVLHQNFTASKSHFHIAFEVRLDMYTPLASTAASITLFSFHVAEPGLSIHWDIVQGGGTLAGNSPPSSYYHVDTLMPAAGTAWHHVDLDVIVGVPTSVISLILDHNVATKADTSTNTAVGAGTANFDLGLYSTGPASAARVSYDNVVYTED